MSPQMSRRDFLKLLALLPLSRVKRHHSLGEKRRLLHSHGAPNILILVFDALSAKHMSVYGYNRQTTPNLARFAERATAYHAHYSAGNFTTPGVASILTGTYPWSHRALHFHGTVAENYRGKNLFRALAPEAYHGIAYSHNVLATLLLHQFRRDLDVFPRTGDLQLFNREFSDQVLFNDYNVALWSEWFLLGEGRSPPGSLFLFLLDRMRRFLYENEFAKEYGSLFPRGLPYYHRRYFLLERAIDDIEAQLSSSPRPFLAYFHLWPPHSPYATRREFIDLFDDGWTAAAKEDHFFSQGHSDEFLNRARRAYDEYIAYTDAEFGRLYDFMGQTGVLDDTYVVVKLITARCLKEAFFVTRLQHCMSQSFISHF